MTTIPFYFKTFNDLAHDSQDITQIREMHEISKIGGILNSHLYLKGKDKYFFKFVFILEMEVNFVMHEILSKNKEKMYMLDKSLLNHMIRHILLTGKQNSKPQTGILGGLSFQTTSDKKILP